MKFAPLLLVAPVVLQAVAADPRPTPAIDVRALDRWQFPRPRQDTSEAAGGGNTATQTGGGGGGGGATTTQRETTTSTSAAPSPTPSPTTTSAAQETRSTAVEPTSTTKPDVVVSPTPSPTSSAAQNTPAPSAATSAAPLTTATPSPSAMVTTDDSGKAFTSIIYVTPTVSAANATNTANTDEDKGIKTPTIIGLAVTGGIAVLIVILLIVWKLTNKRFSDLEDTGDDAIKWPELHKDSAAMTPIPARSTVRAGVDEDFDRQSTAAHSTTNLTGAYQPYSDDPGYGAQPGYYDPYGGAPGAVKTYASPPGSHDGDHKNWGAAADTQSQYYDVPRGASPGPNMAYGDSMGRASPAPPNAGYADPTARTGSPAPTAYGYGGGYAGGYDQGMGGDPYGGRHSPGPNVAYGGPPTYGRQSPGPNMAYGAGVGRVASPGPNVAYDQGYR